MNEELVYKPVEEVKAEGKFVKAIGFKPKVAPIIGGVIGLVLLFVNNIIARILGAFFVLLSFLVFKEIKDYKVMDIFDKGIMVYGDRENKLACFVPFDIIKEWSINRDNGNDSLEVRLMDDSWFLKNTFEIDKVYKTLSSLIKEKDKNYIRQQKNKMLSIPEAFENIKKKYFNK